MPQSIDSEFQDSNQWRNWLEKNHSSQTELWVIIQKKKSQKKGIKYEQALEEAICFGWIDSKMQSIDSDSFRLRFSPRRKKSIWSKKNKITAQKMIQSGKMAKPGLQAIQIAKQNGKWDRAYSSKVAPQIPKDLADALKQNDLAWKNFGGFSNSVKFQYVHWVTSAKRDATRQKRISEVVKKSIQNVKPS